MRTRALRDRDVPLTQIARAVSPVSLGGGCRAAAGNGGAPLQARALPSAPYAQTATRRHRRAGIRFGLIRISDDGRAVVSAGSRRRQYSGSTCANRHGVATSYDVDRTQKSDRSSSRSVWPTSSRSRAQGRRRRRGLQGRWVRLDYPIVSFGKQSFGKITYDTVESTAHFNSAFPGTVIALFDDQRWDAQLRKHRPSERLVAYCQFATIDKVPFLANIYRLRFYGTGRELPLY